MKLSARKYSPVQTSSAQIAAGRCVFRDILIKPGADCTITVYDGPGTAEGVALHPPNLPIPVDAGAVSMSLDIQCNNGIYVELVGTAEYSIYYEN